MTGITLQLRIKQCITYYTEVWNSSNECIQNLHLILTECQQFVLDFFIFYLLQTSELALFHLYMTPASLPSQVVTLLPNVVAAFCGTSSSKASDYPQWNTLA